MSESREHFLGTEVGEVRIVDLDVSEAGCVEDFELFAVGAGYVGEVFGVGGVDFLGVCVSGLVAEVVPIWSCEGDFCFFDFVGWEEVLEIVPLREVGASDVFYFAGAVDGFTGFVAFFQKGVDVRDIAAEGFERGVLDFFESLEAGEEGPPCFEGQFGGLLYFTLLRGGEKENGRNERAMDDM